ncbi:nickel/cobalt ABC transporter permease [Halobacillus kuroshimensis]|uniref:nickel/cobalt ABC transporter permease n=1 Tax=Halobacillus kuroshimensis TaxID=302481 RepID=UPI00041B25A9|nr:nickel/cobalt ABC transporter permease [Halobacillus kuroshimensis]
MALYTIRRLAAVFPILIIISFLTFFLINLSPFNPAEILLQARGIPVITDDLILQTEEELGLNDPFIVQYFNWLMDCFQLNFGTSYVTGEPVWNEIKPAFINTLKLTVLSSFIIVGLSILLGVICAINEGKFIDKSVRSMSFVLIGMPSYWLASLMIWYFSVELDLLPTSGMSSAESYILPVSIITVSYVGIYFRVIRTSMLSNLNEDYVFYGRASGLPEKKITLHLLRNSLQVSISVFCMGIPTILGGTVVIENIFAWPGLGSLSVDSILKRDFPIIQTYVLLLGASFVVFNTLSDLINMTLNPKLRKGF